MARRMGSSGGQRGGGGLDVYVCVCLREVGVGQIGERGEKMQKCLCHVSMEINKLCCMHNTPYHTCMQVYTQSTRREREEEELHAEKWAAVVLLYYLFPYCFVFDFKAMIIQMRPNIFLSINPY